MDAPGARVARDAHAPGAQVARDAHALHGNRALLAGLAGQAGGGADWAAAALAYGQAGIGPLPPSNALRQAQLLAARELEHGVSGAPRGPDGEPAEAPQEDADLSTPYVSRAAASSAPPPSAAPPSAPSSAASVAPAGGAPLPDPIRRRMEAAFGKDLRGVRIHVGADAARAAADIDAKAFAQGAHLWFGAGAYAPDTPDGARLLAHELQHVVQAAEGRLPTGDPERRVSQPSDAHEIEADAVAERVVRGVPDHALAPLGPVPTGGPVSRKKTDGATGTLQIEAIRDRIKKNKRLERVLKGLSRLAKSAAQDKEGQVQDQAQGLAASNGGVWTQEDMDACAALLAEKDLWNDVDALSKLAGAAAKVYAAELELAGSLLTLKDTIQQGHLSDPVTAAKVVTGTLDAVVKGGALGSIVADLAKSWASKRMFGALSESRIDLEVVDAYAKKVIAFDKVKGLADRLAAMGRYVEWADDAIEAYDALSGAFDGDNPSSEQLRNLGRMLKLASKFTKRVPLVGAMLGYYADALERVSKLVAVIEEHYAEVDRELAVALNNGRFTEDTADGLGGDEIYAFFKALSLVEGGATDEETVARANQLPKRLRAELEACGLTEGEDAISPEELADDDLLLAYVTDNRAFVLSRLGNRGGGRQQVTTEADAAVIDRTNAHEFPGGLDLYDFFAALHAGTASAVPTSVERLLMAQYKALAKELGDDDAGIDRAWLWGDHGGLFGNEVDDPDAFLDWCERNRGKLQTAFYGKVKPAFEKKNKQKAPTGSTSSGSSSNTGSPQGSPADDTASTDGGAQPDTSTKAPDGGATEEGKDTKPSTPSTVPPALPEDLRDRIVWVRYQFSFWSGRWAGALVSVVALAAPDLDEDTRTELEADLGEAYEQHPVGDDVAELLRTLTTLLGDHRKGEATVEEIEAVVEDLEAIADEEDERLEAVLAVLDRYGIDEEDFEAAWEEVFRTDGAKDGEMEPGDDNEDKDDSGDNDDSDSDDGSDDGSDSADEDSDPET